MRAAVASILEPQPVIKMHSGIRFQHRDAKRFAGTGCFIEKSQDQSRSDARASMFGQKSYVDAQVFSLCPFDEHSPDAPIAKHYDLVIGPRKLRAVSLKLSFELDSKNRVALRGIEHRQIVSHRLAEQLVQEVFVVGIHWTQRDGHRFEPPKLSCNA
jgi:hypothetical protein